MSVAVALLLATGIPAGHRLLAEARLQADRRDFRIVATGTPGGGDRPLLIFERRGGHETLIARNDHVVLRADEGGQCDPFVEDDRGSIAVKGRYFTIENGVACGQHWTDFVTFRLTPAGFVFDNQRVESWALSDGRDPDADALVRDGPPRVIRGDSRRPIPFARWRRPRD